MKMGGRAYKNGVRLFGEKYSVFAYYQDGQLQYKIGKNTLKDNKFYTLAKKIPIIRGMVSLIFSLFFFFKEASKRPKRFWPILSLFALNIALELYFYFFPANSTLVLMQFTKINPLIYWLGFIGIAFLLRSTILKEIFKFHGAEHKAVNYYESDYKDTIDGHSRLARRCGSNLVAFYLIIIFTLEIIGWTFNPYLESLLVLGISYELILFVPDLFLSIPYLLQRFTTIEPDSKHLLASQTALKVLVAHEREVVKCQRQSE